MPYHIPIIIIAGLAIGVGAAIYANRENIQAFAQQKKLQWQLENARKNRKSRSEYSESSESHIPMQEMHQDDEDTKSIDTAEFLSQDVTNYYSSGQTSSAVDYEPINEDVSIRRRPANMTVSQPAQVPGRNHGDFYQSHSPQAMSPISVGTFSPDVMSLHSFNTPEFLSDREPSLDSRSESFESDMSWSTDSFSDIEHPSGSEIDIVDDDRRALMRN